MSGLVAIVNLNSAPVDQHLLGRLTDALDSRGKDKKETWINGHIGFGHTLHRTTNEAEYEHQPCTLDGNVWLIASARIDAREELVNKLGLQHQLNLKQTPDTELILHAYHTWGEQCLNHILGDFAFVIWDGRNQKLFCARDRFGMRQLYYSRIKNSILICNSLYCLLHHPQISFDVNDQVIGDFLLFGNPVWLDKKKILTAFNDVQKVPPAHTLIIKDRKYSIHRYWTLPTDLPTIKYKDECEYIHHFQEIFKTAIKDRLRCQNVVVSMSGGLDSTSIAATVSEINEETSNITEMHAVTNAYDSLCADDEPYYADLVAKKLKISIDYIDASDYSFLNSSILTVYPMEFYLPDIWLATYQKSASKSRVFLTGNVADNLFVSSPLLRMKMTELMGCNAVSNFIKMYMLYGQLPAIGTGILSTYRRLLGARDITSFYPAWLDKQFELNMRMKDRWVSFHGLNGRQSNRRNSEIHDSLTEPDWNIDDVHLHSEFVFPEERDPFMDLRLIEYILSLPPLPWLFKKHILRTSMKNKLPMEVLQRPKTAMGETLLYWLKDKNITWVDNWEAIFEIEKYIIRDKIPVLLNTTDYYKAVTDIRPLILNQWLLGISELKAVINNKKSA
ncbi:MAG: asparagine synthase (glutamine-hydrolyzing) [Gammaproteobacteria bacterium]|jgi:asparagine synthase (glutamine-hydrolysing)